MDTSGNNHSSLDPVLSMQRSSSTVTRGIGAVMILYAVVWGTGILPGAHKTTHEEGHAPAVSHEGDHSETRIIPASHPVESPNHGDETHPYVPSWVWVTPFALLLGSIAILPLLSATEHWWHRNRNRFIVAVVLGSITLAFYAFGHPGGIDNHFTGEHGTAPGLSTAFAAFSNAMFEEFIPFIVLLFSLYVISGGINLSGDLPAHPRTNCAFLGIGALLASFVGTTGAAMVFIRPLLATNAERKKKTHTVMFFIFLVCNCGGLLLPIGDPPLFLGYLKGVPFGWTLGLLPYWLAVNLFLLVVYYVWDTVAYRSETKEDIRRDDTEVQPLRLTGKINILFMLGVVLCVALVVPGRPLIGSWAPPLYLRELMMLGLVALSLICTHATTRVKNRFDYVAIVEVAALFCGIFLCMQVPIEILNVKGSQMGIESPSGFYWMTGILSSFLDNAPTYVVFFETAKTMGAGATEAVVHLGGNQTILESLLVPISLGAVFMGANTYIGNGPNFMVKSIAEQSGVAMPSFFGYMLYSAAILLPTFAVVSFFL
jgi:Na+/H+ antiporter NhaD/arsenite permease-like protein